MHAEEDEKLPVLAGADPAQGPEQQALAKDGAARIEADIRALKEPYHLVSVAYFLEQKPPEQIAQELGRPVKTVHTQLARARRMLQAEIREKGECRMELFHENGHLTPEGLKALTEGQAGRAWRGWKPPST